MKDLKNELLLLGAVVLLVFKAAFYFDNYVFENSFLADYTGNLIENTVLFFVLYLGIAVLFGVRLISRLVTNNSAGYYMKAIGWIAYAYLFGAIWYLNSQDFIIRYFTDNCWDFYPISEICIVVSLLIAWVRRHPKFLME
jgi:predicted MFS family arabinose efflux permease